MSVLASISSYLKGSVEEMKKVTWPSKKETQDYTILVIVMSVVVALYLGGLDYLFNKAVEYFIQR